MMHEILSDSLLSAEDVETSRGIIEREIDAGQASNELKALQDRFLDKYSEYLKSPNSKMKEELDAMVREIKRLDSSFNFHIDS